MNTLNRRQTTHSEPSAADRRALPQMAQKPAESESETASHSPRLLREAAREAGLFQRSVMGHLDHEGWSSRVLADGQRLADLLSEMGFSPKVVKLRR